MNLSFFQKLRNKIKVKGIDNIVDVEDNKQLKFYNNKVTINGNNNKLTIGKNTNIRSTDIEIIGNNCEITIGDNTIVGHDSYISTKEEGTIIKIGSDCMFSRNTKIMASDGHPVFQNGKKINHAQDITIEDFVWLADNVTVLKGVSIGKNSVIGINSTVTKNIASATLAVGNPAKVVKENISWDK